MADTYISVWYDDVSDEHGWIVDRCDEDDNSATVKCYLVECDEDPDTDETESEEYAEAEAEAREFAAKYSENTGLPIR